MIDTNPKTTQRYQILDDSASGHCCFGFTVIDTQKVRDVIPGKTYFETICECFERKYAELICAALNGVSSD